VCPNRFDFTVDVAPNWKLAYISQTFFPNVAGSEIIDEADLNGPAYNSPPHLRLTVRRVRNGGCATELDF
jgi:hypothetical protein